MCPKLLYQAYTRDIESEIPLRNSCPDKGRRRSTYISARCLPLKAFHVKGYSYIAAEDRTLSMYTALRDMRPDVTVLS